MRFATLVFLLCMSIGSPNPASAFCFEEAGNRYGISPQLLYAISKGESSFNPLAINYNTNGTYDYGLMQINSSWEPALRKLGISWNNLADPCTNVMVGAWVLSQCIQDYGYTWPAVGCYNSRTPSKRDRYAARVARIIKHELSRPQPVQVASAINVATPWEEAFGRERR
ncbi:lytic transglycosylase domain-containing protein [Geobacter anodireducens]|uniref:Lytic transglycosylase domain-containing protein n=1 Tax=Geobacter anodireducens TaxID=1340425 RepID=A0ABR9NXB9_9BACT|nr:lytic transglycosylase domain-containing protein [Geobacter anodireducens]MBE2888908.1 lytic transglycosylase domain-containing protein [Geobacter anodireducens]